MQNIPFISVQEEYAPLGCWSAKKEIDTISFGDAEKDPKSMFLGEGVHVAAQLPLPFG